MAQTKDSEYYDKMFRCERCGEYKVKKKIGSKYTPKYCKDCLKVIRRLSMKKANKARHLKSFEDRLKEEVAPDGSKVYLMNDEEKRFYYKRKKQYLEDFEWIKSSDMALLSRLLMLEVQCRRIEKDLVAGKSSERKSRLLADLTKEMRNVQKELGIDRNTRIKSSEEEDTVSIIQDIIRRFKKYREENRDKFVWKCRHCGRINFLYRINKNEGEYVEKNEIENKDEGTKDPTPLDDQPINKGGPSEKDEGKSQPEG